MTKQQYIKYGGYAVFIILCAVLVFTVFKCNKIKSDYKVDLKASEEREKAYAREVEIYREWKDKEIAEGLKKDSLLEAKIKQSEIRIKTIAPAVRGISSKQELHRQGADFKPE